MVSTQSRPRERGVRPAALGALARAFLVPVTQWRAISPSVSLKAAVALRGEGCPLLRVGTGLVPTLTCG